MELKGSALASTLRAIERLHGTAGYHAVRLALPAHVRSVLEDGPVLPMRWYPVEVVAAVHDGVRVVLGHGGWELSHALGKEAAREDFSNIYAVVIRVLQPSTVWSRMERMWRIYNSRGHFHWIDLGPGYMHAIIRDVSGYNPGMWNAVAGRGQQVVSMTGAKGADVHVVRSTPSEGELEGMWLE